MIHSLRIDKNTNLGRLEVKNLLKINPSSKRSTRIQEEKTGTRVIRGIRSRRGDLDVNVLRRLLLLAEHLPPGRQPPSDVPRSDPRSHGESQSKGFSSSKNEQISPSKPTSDSFYFLIYRKYPWRHSQSDEQKEATWRPSAIRSSPARS